MVKILLFGVYVGVPVAVWTNKNLRFRAFWLRVQGLGVLVCVSSPQQVGGGFRKLGVPYLGSL